MSVKCTAQYLGNKKVRITHEPSGAQYVTDAPKDNQGEGSSFSPTDLVGAALGSCIMTTIALFAERDGIDLAGMKMEVEKHMSSSPRRISQLPVTIHLPAKLPQETRDKLERVGKACPVHKSLHPETEAPITFLYDV